MASIIVHGGAWNIPADERDDHRRGCRLAVEEGWAVLAGGGSALEAATRAIVVMEDDPVFDAGRGSFLNSDGLVELDASVMRGDTLDVGAVAALQGFPNPILVARALMATPHALLVGAGAARLAADLGFQPCPPENLVTPRELERWVAYSRDAASLAFEALYGGSTVGAVARDDDGLIVSATSTGGMPMKAAGRVGDTPLIGCGTYADSRAGAASCSGWGEGIIRVTMARAAVTAMEAGLGAMDAAEAALSRLAGIDGRGGLIAIDRSGRVGFAYNTGAMAIAYMRDEMADVTSFTSRDEIQWTIRPPIDGAP